MNTVPRTTVVALAIGLLAAGPAAAATQLILGRSFQVGDPSGDPSGRRIVGSAQESSSANTVEGDPTSSGATLTIIADGATPTTQTFELPASGWSAIGDVGYQWSNASHPASPVRRAIIKRTTRGVFLLKVQVDGRSGPVEVVPPAPGVSGSFILTIGNGDGYCAGFGGAAGGQMPRNDSRQWTVKRPTAEGCAQALTLGVLSNRADLISGGNALVQVVLPPGTDASDVTVDLDGMDVTGAFALRDDGRYLGVVTELALGDNVLTARAPGVRAAAITITNHPIGGPVFSGEQLQPWLCTTDGNGLGPAQDEQCNAGTIVEYFYRPTGGVRFMPYDPENPPSDVATVTTDQGEMVPYVIRQETGTHNRGIYRVAVLFDPAQPWEPWSPQRGWNRKLHYLFGPSCGTVHSQSNAQNVQNDRALSRGFMVATSSLNVLGNNCNTTTSAESVMMLKEHIVETYGEIRYTTAEGCSGGSIGQHMVANNYPGLLQGIQPNCSFTDNWSTGLEVVDCHLLLNYFTAVSPQLWAAPNQQSAVSGHASFSSCVAWEALFAPVVDPEGGCGLSADQDYDPVDNPTGCRGSVPDFNVAVIGRRPPELWDQSPEPTRSAEYAAGGFARLPYDNVGVQYGLEALLAGQILTEQFVDLNEKIGTVDIDFNYASGRRHADTGSELLYRAGGVNDGGQLDQVAIIDLRGTSNAEIHTDYHSYVMRERLIRSNGHADNHIIWTTPAPLVPPPAVADAAFDLLDRWLAAIEADTTADPLEVKVTRNKPADAVDACLINDQMVTDMAACSAAFPYFGSPRLVAGMPLSHDIAACQTRPLDRDDYASVVPPLTDEQWARLQAAFPEGVCDYGLPGVGQEPSVPWLTYKDGPGGQPLGEPPVSAPAD
ncbi:MAG TPA: DUF6351 family protein [Candidatus Limnocylindrales bacterium]|nr:DUF6351 family protein [Candidatus Limnocylindrales bacterium]